MGEVLSSPVFLKFNFMIITPNKKNQPKGDKMKIKFNRTVATAYDIYKAGDVADIYEKHAKKLIAKGHAEEVIVKKENKRRRKTKEDKSE
jgi:hypothetical protein